MKLCHFYRTAQCSSKNSMTLSSFPWLSITFAIFHDFPGLENGLPKFHNFPWPGGILPISTVITSLVKIFFQTNLLREFACGLCGIFHVDSIRNMVGHTFTIWPGLYAYSSWDHQNNSSGGDGSKEVIQATYGGSKTLIDGRNNRLLQVIDVLTAHHQFDIIG